MARPTCQLGPMLVACAFAALAAAAGATQFRVGGDRGWSVPDAGVEPYNAWAGRLRFQIGDQLLFVYPKEADSVLVVDAAAYNACNTSAYASRFDDGSTVVTLDRSGPFFFVSGNDTRCRANEKLIVVVLAPRTPPAAPPPNTNTPPPAPAPLPAPTASPPAMSPSSPPSSGPAPAASPTSPPSSPLAPGPAPTTTPTSPPSSPLAPGPAPTTTPTSPPPPAAQTPSPSATPTPGGGSPPPSSSANAPAAEGNRSTTTPPPSAAPHVVAGLVGSLGAFVGYAMLAA